MTDNAISKEIVDAAFPHAHDAWPGLLEFVLSNRLGVATSALVCSSTFISRLGSFRQIAPPPSPWNQRSPPNQRRQPEIQKLHSKAGTL